MDNEENRRSGMKALLWIAPAVGITLLLWGRDTYSSLITTASAGVGTFSIYHLVGSLIPIFAYFLTNIFKNKTVARALYVIVFLGVLYLFYWDRLWR